MTEGCSCEFVLLEDATELQARKACTEARQWPASTPLSRQHAKSDFSSSAQGCICFPVRCGVTRKYLSRTGTFLAIPLVRGGRPAASEAIRGAEISPAICWRAQTLHLFYNMDYYHFDALLFYNQTGNSFLYSNVSPMLLYLNTLFPPSLFNRLVKSVGARFG